MFSENLLTKILSIQSKNSKDNKDAKMVEYIKRFINSNKLIYEEDSYGNIYVTKGIADYYPCFVSHVDTVHDIEDDFQLLKINNNLIAYNSKKMKQVGIGGDDKVGVFICLSLLRQLDVVKVIFFKDEEGGCIGSNFSTSNYKDWYIKCSYIVAIDRRGSRDIITESHLCTNKMITAEFESDFFTILKKYGYREEKGSVSDATTLFENNIGVCCINISCGYYNPHSNDEYVNIQDIENTYTLVIDMTTSIKLNKRYINTPLKKAVTYYSSTNYSSNHPTTNFPLFKNLYIDELISNNNSPKFKLIRSSNMLYELVSKKSILLTLECPYCKLKDCLYITKAHTENLNIYCIECQKYVTHIGKEEVNKKLNFTHNYKTLVYKKQYRQFIDLDYVTWCDKTKDWILK